MNVASISKVSAKVQSINLNSDVNLPMKCLAGVC